MGAQDDRVAIEKKKLIDLIEYVQKSAEVIAEDTAIRTSIRREQFTEHQLKIKAANSLEVAERAMTALTDGIKVIREDAKGSNFSVQEIEFAYQGAMKSIESLKSTVKKYLEP